MEKGLLDIYVPDKKFSLGAYTQLKECHKYCEIMNEFIYKVRIDFGTKYMHLCIDNCFNYIEISKEVNIKVKDFFPKHLV
jgi:hypothetical protein